MNDMDSEALADALRRLKAADATMDSSALVEARLRREMRGLANQSRSLERRNDRGARCCRDHLRLGACPLGADRPGGPRVFSSISSARAASPLSSSRCFMERAGVFHAHRAH